MRWLMVWGIDVQKGDGYVWVTSGQLFVIWRGPRARFVPPLSGGAQGLGRSPLSQIRTKEATEERPIVVRFTGLRDSGSDGSPGWR